MEKRQGRYSVFVDEELHEMLDKWANGLPVGTAMSFLTKEYCRKKQQDEDDLREIKKQVAKIYKRLEEQQ
jgi:hypothetical protein